MEKVMAFAYSAGEFLDEEMSEMEDKYGKELKFFTEGEFRRNESSRHPFEYWAPQEACDEINKLMEDNTEG